MHGRHTEKGEQCHILLVVGFPRAVFGTSRKTHTAKNAHVNKTQEDEGTVEEFGRYDNLKVVTKQGNK